MAADKITATFEGSSLLAAIRLDTTPQTMVVWFNNGGVAQYEGVTLNEYFEVINAESAGQKFNELFRNRPYLKLK